MRYLITGATGLLGRNLLYEILRRELLGTEPPEILLLGRSGRQRGASFVERIQSLFKEEDGQEVLRYLGMGFPKTLRQLGIECIEADLDKIGLGISQEDALKMVSKPIDVIFHVAARLDFRNTDPVKEKLARTNIAATKELLRLLQNCNVGEFCFIGSAYSCGMTTGVIEPDYNNLNQRFRNPYERTKLEAENIVRTYCKDEGVRFRIFRPSTISGNLMTHPPGYTPKFDVFYAWSLFFLRTKYEFLQSLPGLCEHPFHIDCRILYNSSGGINIVPADYAAKVVYEVCSQKVDGDSFHLVNNQETPHAWYIKKMLETINVEGVVPVETLPRDLTVIEDVYYNKSVGAIYTPYITMEPMLFSTDNLKPVLKRAGIDCPPIDSENFTTLMHFAKTRLFGLEELLARQKMKSSRSHPASGLQTLASGLIH